MKSWDEIAKNIQADTANDKKQTQTGAKPEPTNEIDQLIAAIDPSHLYPRPRDAFFGIKDMWERNGYITVGQLVTLRKFKSVCIHKNSKSHRYKFGLLYNTKPFGGFR